MKKITFLVGFCLLMGFSASAQFSCATAVPLTDGYSQMAITTPGTAGPEDWVTSANTNGGANALYWDDDVYLFQYTAGATDEAITIQTFSRKSWNGLGIFTTCDGTSLSGALASQGNTGTNSTKTLSAVVPAGQTVYIASGQWGTPNDLDFDVLSFAAVPLVNTPDCTSVSAPVDGASDVALTAGITWTAATGFPTGYKLTVGTTSGGTDVLNNFNVGNVLTYNIPGLYQPETTYYVTVTAFNGNGDATGCSETSFTTVPPPAPGNLCENSIVIDALPYNAVDDTANFADTYEGSPGATGCSTTSAYLNGNDIVYSYTATFTGSIKLVMTPTATWTGLFIYDSCANIGVNCLGGIANSGTGVRTIPEFPVTTGQTYYFVISTWAAPQSSAFTLDITENTCTNGAATFTVVSDCANGEQFNVAVDVTSLGSATSVTISDDQSSVPVTVSATGITTMGPYPNGTSVIFTVVNDQDASCSITSPARTQTSCPPANDNCLGAVALDVNPEYECISFGSGTVAGATLSTVTGNTCGGTADDDVWFSFVATGTKHRISLTNIAGSTVDMYHSLWTGDCANLTLVPGSCSDANTSNPSGLVADQTYYVRVYTWTSTANQTSTFDICIGTPPPPPANDNFANAAAMTCGETYTGSTELATLDEDNAPDFGPADMDAPNVWYSYTGSGTPETVTLNLCQSAYDTSVLVYTGTSGNLTAIAGNDDAGTTACPGNGTRSLVSFTSDGTTTYYIAVEGYNVGSVGAYTMEVSCNAVTPPAVENQTCATALVVPTDGSDTMSDNSFGDVTATQPSCDTFGSIQDVWFSFVAPAGGAVEVTVTNAGLLSGNMNIYSGDCGALTPVAGTCNADFTTSSVEALANLVEGNSYYVQVWSNASEQGGFALRVLDANMSVNDPAFGSFSHYPNPVKNELNLSSAKNISDVAVFNILGQQVVTKAINANQTKIDMSNLSAGTYIVKVTSENLTKTFKVVKQ